MILIDGWRSMFGRRFARRIGKALADSMADLGIPVLLGCFLVAFGTAYRARPGNRRPDHRCRADGSCRRRRLLYRLAARLYRIGNGGRFGRLQPLQRLRLRLVGRLLTWTYRPR